MQTDATTCGVSADVSKTPRAARVLPVGVLLLLVTAGLYLPFVGIPYFADDYEYVYVQPGPAIYHQFVARTPGGGHWRPLKASWCALNQLAFGTSTFVLESSQALVHAASALLIYLFLRRRGIGLGPALAAAGVFVVHPVATPAVLGNDTGDQVLGTALGFASVFCAWEFLEAGRSSPARPRCGWAVGAVASLGVAVLSKETSMAFPVLLTILLVGARWTGLRAADRRAWRGQLALTAGCVLVTLAYLLYRQLMAPVRVRWGESQCYDFQIGLVTLKNLGMLVGALLLPVSTADVFVAAVRRQYVLVALAGAFAAAWTGLLAWGALWARGRRLALAALVAAAMAAFPAAGLYHVSELYSYNMLPFFAVAVAVALEYLLVQGRRTALRGCAWAIVLAVLASSAVAVWRKAAEMEHCGRAQATIVDQLVPIARDLPANGKLVLKEQHRPGKVYYSVNLVTDFHEMYATQHWVRYRAQRPDITIRVVSEKEPIPADATLVLVRTDDTDHPKIEPLSSQRP